jgi:hypothetical protein
MKSKLDLLIAPLGEAAMVLVVAAIGWAAHQPLVFASLGPTIYEMIEQPKMKSAKPYNVVVGHLVGLGAGYLALWLLHAWSSPKVASAGFVSSPRIWAAVIAVTLTTLVTLAIQASQPASLATALLVSLGSMQTARDAVAIIIGVLIVAAMGEPVRRVRAKSREQQPAPS